MISWQILPGDNFASLRSLPGGSVQTCITSPPYYGLRDYGHEGQIGLEESPQEYVARLAEVFREVRRVLRDDGTLWLNLGDSYAGSWGAQSRENPVAQGASTLSGGTMLSARQIAAHPKRTHTGSTKNTPGCKPKDLLGIPWMVAFALRDDGWYLRSEVIWAKPNPMPESVTDRPTKAHEQVFLLAKSARYFYDADAVREDSAVIEQGRTPGPESNGYHVASGRGDGGAHLGGMGFGVSESGRNKRTVWTVATQPFSGAHFAVFPPKLIEPMVLAGSSDKACAECGRAWERVTDGKTYYSGDDGTRTRKTNAVGNGHGGGGRGPKNNLGSRIATTIGFEPACTCNAGTTPSVVLDPFAGSGTTGMVALRHGRSFIGCELNPEYVEIARRRIVDDAPLLNAPAESAA